MKPDLPDEIGHKLISEDSNEVGLVIRSHLYIEILLNELLSLLTPVPEHLESMNLTYANKVKLACAMGLDPEFKSMLLALGTIRNKFSHNLNKTIDADMVKDLHSQVHSKTRESFPKFINKLNESGQKINSFNEGHPRDQFTALVINLWVIMHGAVKEAKSERHL